MENQTKIKNNPEPIIGIATGQLIETEKEAKENIEDLTNEINKLKEDKKRIKKHFGLDANEVANQIKHSFTS